MLLLAGLLVVVASAIALRLPRTHLFHGIPSTTTGGGEVVPEECVSPVEDACTGAVDLGSGWRIPYYRNYPLAQNSAVTSAVIVVHGTGRNARSYFAGMLAAAANAHVRDRTLVLVPDFQATDDDPAEGTARWESEGWKIGDPAVSPSGLSSFEVLDRILDRLANKGAFPNLVEITLVGHSAGGQFVQRYAAIGLEPSLIRAPRIHYVVANPSSYLYLDRYRPDLNDPTGHHFMIPQNAQCDYNDYKYGLDHRNSYGNRTDDNAIIAQYISRRVTYLLGDADVFDNHSLDTDCAAALQGQNRFQRGVRYYNYIRSYFPTAPHDLVVVPGVGHDHDKMFASAQGEAAIFGGMSQAPRVPLPLEPPSQPNTTAGPGTPRLGPSEESITPWPKPRPR